MSEYNTHTIAAHSMRGDSGRVHKQAGRLDKLRAGVITLQPCKYISLDVDRFDLQTAKSQIAEIKGPGDLLKVFERVGINRCARNLIPASCARVPLTSAR